MGKIEKSIIPNEVVINGHKVSYDKDKDAITMAEIPNDLEEAAENWICNHKYGEVLFVKDAFIAGAKWQAEQLLKSSPLPEDTVLFNKGVEEGKRLMMEEWLKDRDGCFWDGVEEGKKAMKEQMMKEAVEGEVMTNGFYPYEPRVVASIPGTPFNFGDKVRIIIVKED